MGSSDRRKKSKARKRKFQGNQHSIKVILPTITSTAAASGVQIQEEVEKQQKFFRIKDRF